MDDFPHFSSVKVRTLDHLVYSCFFLQTWPKRKWSLSSSTSGSGMHSAGFAGEIAPRAALPTIPSRTACTR